MTKISTKEKRKSPFAKEKIEKGEIFLKVSITFFFAVAFILSFLALGGMKFFEPAVYVDAFVSLDFQIHTIDVENGDAFLLKLPQNKTMLIDCGEEKYNERVISYLRQYFQSEGLNEIDYFVLTHTDSDHVGNAKEIMETFKVKNLYRPKKYAADEGKYIALDKQYKVDFSQSYNNAIKAAYEKNCNIIFSQNDISLSFDNCKITFLSPTENDYTNDNNYSAVLMIEYFSCKFLFMGDAEVAVENLLMTKYGEKLQADVLKLAHHGSKTSTSEAFLTLVNPKYAILSCSENSSILPSAEIIERVEKQGCEILSTASLGNFALSLKQNRVVCEDENQPFNFWPIVFSVLLIFDLILWKMPFLRKKDVQNTQKH